MTERTDTINPSENLQAIESIVDHSIRSTFGMIDALPGQVIVRLRSIYREFIPVYLEMIRIRDNRPREWTPKRLVVDHEVVDGMGHFYSDYQHLIRDLKRINRQIKQLIKIDPKADPYRYEELVEKIVSDGEEKPVMSSILEQ